MVGCIVKTKFVTPSSDIFGGYIDYIDRENAVRNEHISSYSIYTNYMGNPEKTSDLFTASSNHLNQEEKEQLKNTYIKAQKNGSLMWQTIISFDNCWLEQNGLWNNKTNMLDKNKLINYCRNSVNAMLKAENLENSIWSAAIHYNTDNIHIHIATVEPIPTRQKMIINGEEEIRGKFKLSSINTCKSKMINQIVELSLDNQKINEIMRESIINSIKDDILLENKEIVTQYLSVYNKLPSDKRAWKYGMNKIAALRPEIDKITNLYINKYHSNEYKQLKDLLARQNNIYSEAYGGETSTEFVENKIKDLYKRCGNRILSSMKNFAFSDLKEKENLSYIEAEINEAEQTDEPLDFDGKIEIIKSNRKRNKYALSKKWWNNDYKTIKVLLSKALTCEEADKKLDALSDIEAKFIEQSELGNCVASFELGRMYENGTFGDVDNVKAQEYYASALKGFIASYPESQGNAWMQDYINYKIGRMYIDGKGCEPDIQSGIKYLEKSNSPFASYTLGCLYYRGNEVKADMQKAYDYFSYAAEPKDDYTSIPFAKYNMAQMLEKGIIKNESHNAENLYQSALNSFKTSEQNSPNDLTEYRIAVMLLDGKGCEPDIKEAKKYLIASAKFGNTYAQTKLAQLYLNENNPEKAEKAIKLLTKAAEAENISAQYQLGKIYTDKSNNYFNAEKGLKLLEQAAKQGNEFAQYKLGLTYIDNEFDYKNIYKALNYFTQSAEKGNQFAQYQLGLIYLKGDEIKQNPDLAIQYLNEAAEQGNQFAQYQLGLIYLKGELTGKNEYKAINYLEQAAEHSNQFAQYQLGKLFLFGGDEIEPDKDRAFKYLNASATQGNEYAKSLLEWKPHNNNYVAQKPFDDSLISLSDNIRMLFSRLNDEHAHMLNQQIYNQLEQSKKKEEKEREK